MVMRGVGLLAVVVLSGRVALAAAPSAPPAPASQRPAKERRLHVAGADASSYLVNDWNKFQENYLPLYVGDDDPRTAWSLKDEGIGAWLRVHVTPMQGASKLRMKIRNGYQKTPRLWAANSRAKELTVTLLPSKKTVDVTLEDRWDWQEIAVEQPAGAFDAVELRVKSVYPGKKYDDLCISDVQVFVTATSSDNPAFEKQHADKIAAWKKERVAAAKMFKNQLGQSLPIAAQYTTESQQTQDSGGGRSPDATGCDKAPVATRLTCSTGVALRRALKADTRDKHAAALRRAEALARNGFGEMTAVRVSARDKRRVPVVDGLCVPDLGGCFEDLCEGRMPMPMTGQLGYLNADALALVEQRGLPSFADAMDQKPPQCSRAENATFAWAARDPVPAGASEGGVGRLRALLLVVCGQIEGREGSYPASKFQLLVYGDDGRLELAADSGEAVTFDWEGTGADGPKIARAVVTGAAEFSDLKIEAATAVAANK